ncbi:hypothetical protein [uncultured Algoriphagus sp.]|uniref:hypothetical protein n=1 Tax=uncultured Algoriphagus sp. TaxID=417365 RepID=UPI002584C7B3|nr:hypothetical protein [uncultured Algoriphagus sp.]
MESFDPIQSIYNSQRNTTSELSADRVLNSAKNSLRKLKRDQFWTIGILTLTLSILALYFFKYGQFGTTLLILSLTLMISSLVIRVILELTSRIGLNRLEIYLSTSEFIKSIQSYLFRRKRIHRIFTPMIYLIYGLGVVLFLIALKPYISLAFFIYCVITGVGFWIGFIWVIRKSYRKEWELLNALEKMSKN